MAFTWQSIPHAFASLFKDIVTVSRKAQVVLADIQKDAPMIEALTGLVSPQAAIIEQIAFGSLGALIAAVHGTETAASANGLNVAYDASVIAEIRALIVAFPAIVTQVEAIFPKKK